MELPSWLQPKRDTVIASSDSDPNVKKSRSMELPSWLQPTKKTIKSEVRHSVENTDSSQTTPQPSGSVDIEKSEKDTNGSTTTTSRRDAPFIKKELTEWQGTPKRTQHVEEKIEENGELFCEELRIPKRTNLTANGKPSRPKDIARKVHQQLILKLRIL